DEIRYLSGYSVIEQDGLEGLLKLLRRSVREQHCQLMVIDGVMTAESMAESQIAYKKFIHELQTWVGLIGCTVLLLTSSTTELGGPILPAHTMVDGIIELRTLAVGPRALRQLNVMKFRGAAYSEGGHTYRITDAGMIVFPRLETLPPREGRAPIRAERIRTGIEELDRMFKGGYPAASTTLLLGASGSGKTLLGLHFLDAGTREGQEGILFSFFEKPDLVREKARRLGLIYAKRSTPVHVIWQPPFEGLLDELRIRLLARVDATGATRVFIDGVVGFEEAAISSRLASFFAALANELTARGVTTLISDETATQGIEAIFENIVVVQQIEQGGQLARLISVMKSRETDRERDLRPFAITDRGIVVAAEPGAPRGSASEQSLEAGAPTRRRA